MKINVNGDVAKRILDKYGNTTDPDLAAVVDKIRPVITNPRRALTVAELEALLLAVDEFVDYAEPSLEDHPHTLVADTKALLSTAKPKVEYMLEKTRVMADAGLEGGGE